MKLTEASLTAQNFDFKKGVGLSEKKEKPLLYPLLQEKKYDINKYIYRHSLLKFAQTPVTVFLKVLCKF